MGLVVNLKEALGRNFGVSLGGREMTVTEQGLNLSQVGSAGQEVGGEAMTQLVRGDMLTESP